MLPEYAMTRLAYSQVREDCRRAYLPRLRGLLGTESVLSRKRHADECGLVFGLASPRPDLRQILGLVGSEECPES